MKINETELGRLAKATSPGMALLSEEDAEIVSQVLDTLKSGDLIEVVPATHAYTFQVTIIHPSDDEWGGRALMALQKALRNNDNNLDGGKVTRIDRIHRPASLIGSDEYNDALEALRQNVRDQESVKRQLSKSDDSAIVVDMKSIEGMYE